MIDPDWNQLGPAFFGALVTLLFVAVSILWNVRGLGRWLIKHAGNFNSLGAENRDGKVALRGEIRMEEQLKVAELEAEVERLKAPKRSIIEPFETAGAAWPQPRPPQTMGDAAVEKAVEAVAQPVDAIPGEQKIVFNKWALIGFFVLVGVVYALWLAK